MKVNFLILLFLTPMLSGCIFYQPYEGHPEYGAASVNFYSDYTGTFGDADDILYMKIWQPSGEYMTGIPIYNNERRDVEGGGGAFPCPKYEDEWKDTPWWMEVAIYTEPDFEVEVDRLRVDDTDCLLYGFEITKDGQLISHGDGYPSWHPNSKRLQPWVWGTLTVSGAIVGFGGFGLALYWSIRKMRAG